MARIANELTAIQQDDALFYLLAGKIRRIRIIKLSEYGNISHTTLAKYLRREPVEQKTEDEIQRAIASWEAAKVGQDQKRTNVARELVKDLA